METPERQAYLEAKLAELKRDDLSPVVTRGLGSFEIRTKLWPVSCPYSATKEQMDAAIAQVAKLPAYEKKLEPHPYRAAGEKARRYDEQMNEGGEGYNPFRRRR